MVQLKRAEQNLFARLAMKQARLLKKLPFLLTPDETMPQVLEFFQKYDLNAIGIGSFGPVDLNVHSPTYGSITTTPKLA
jgi:hypothetical protein